MGSISIVHWLIVLIPIAVVGFPIAKILQRTGHSRWWAILAFVPLANLIALWVFALGRWPVDGQKA